MPTPRRTVLAALGAAAAALAARAAPQPTRGHVPADGFVPDSATAVAIAVAVWRPIFGADRIARQRPYTAELQGGVWTVAGSLPPGHRGGVALAEIARVDARILRVSHGR